MHPTLNHILKAEEQGQKLDPYAMGYDCGQNGPNTTNCHFGLFSTPERTRQWEQGKRDAERDD